MPLASSPAASTLDASLTALLDQSRRVLAVYAEKPSDAATWQQLVTVRRAVAEAVAALPSTKKEGPELNFIRAFVDAFSQSGAADYSVSSEDLTLARTYAGKGWTGLMAATLLVPAWQWPEAPSLNDVAPWLWRDYTFYLFYTPQGFCSEGHATAFAAHYLRRLEELARWGETNRGSAAVRAALNVYAQIGNCIPLYFSAESLRRHYELRARVLKSALGVPKQDDIFPSMRAGRPLRIGFVNRHFGPQTETYTTLPMFEQLDPDRFEVVLFVHRETSTPVEAYARTRVSDFRVLPADLNQQVDVLRRAALDVVVFGTNVTAVTNEVTQLALYRVAPLQIVNNSSCTTSGLPEVDLYVSGALTEAPEAPEHFSERLGLLPGPAHAFNYDADRQDPTGAWTRAALGIPDDAVVFVTAANYFKIIPEMQKAWARLLAAVPNAWLVVHPFNPNWSSTYPIQRFCAEFDRVLKAHGIKDDRLIVSTNRFPSRSDVRELLSVGDAYLDTFPFGGVNSLVDPLEAGVPVVAWEGSVFRSRMGAALLRSLGLEELVARDAESYHALAVRLATDRGYRDQLKPRIQDAMTCMPQFLDSLAASDSFGALAEIAFDELERNGREAFRRDRTALTAPKVADANAVLLEGLQLLDTGMLTEAADKAREVLAAQPAFPAARQLLGRALTAQGRHERASTYFLSAIQHDGGNPALWHDLAISLHDGGKKQDALQALEACLKLDVNRLDAWLMLGEIAEALGHREMVQEVAQVTQQLAPEDPRVMAVVARIGLL